MPGSPSLKPHSQDYIYRLLDANLNRAREGLRVVEEITRFVFNELQVTKKLRRLREKLSKTSSIVYPKLIHARDVKTDAGRKFKERKRENLNDLLIANFHRAEEAIRVLEEFAKLISADAGEKFKKIRFEVYDLEKKILTNFFDR